MNLLCEIKNELLVQEHFVPAKYSTYVLHLSPFQSNATCIQLYVQKLEDTLHLFFLEAIVGV